MYISYTVLLTEGEKHEIEVGKISNIIKNKKKSQNISNVSVDLFFEK